MSKLKGPTQIVLNITNRCNLRCLHCFNTSGINTSYNDELSDREMLDLVAEIAKVKPYNVCFSGGEPLLRKNLIFECMEILSSHNIRAVMVSNGTLLDKETITTLFKLKIQDIEVSLDGYTAEIHDKLRINGSFRKIIKALELLRDIQFPQYEVSMVLTPFNYSEIRPMINLLRGLKTPLLILRPMLLCGRGLKYKEILQPTPLQYRKMWCEINKLKKTEKEVDIVYGDPLSHIYLFLSGNQFFGMEIKANGDLIISPYIQLPLGNVQRHSIEDYWDKGWSTVYQLPIIKDLVAKIKGSYFGEVESSIKHIGQIDLIDNV